MTFKEWFRMGKDYVLNRSCGDFKIVFKCKNLAEAMELHGLLSRSWHNEQCMPVLDGEEFYPDDFWDRFGYSKTNDFCYELDFTHSPSWYYKENGYTVINYSE